jgi:folate-dependent tRNA-U54 methylase TrmFO/GidA
MELIKNQKCICIKTFEVEEREYGKPIGQYNIGDIVTINTFIEKEQFYDFMKALNSKTSYDEFTNISYFIGLIPFYRNLKLNELIEYFIPLAEWRQQQIDKILEDE